ncbi:MAG TPA: LysR substrate-binding domain-containing protein [Bradyrhizobium sp.]|uniref:LysR substrate-binding domain-containing protein n=1 Tax=Bradyrhizobium sp. TaxID=376 RepID=UPI002D7F172A|nr:LysR substrate-binding domain-containing protein [Bradyrhizobium sp.]HET7885889.1 LysR substrate-binding domain-containing protein [Bradyrhizobium sp.]
MPTRRLPPLHAVRAFEAAARHLSITRAAEELNVTVGAVSRHVRALEDRMGTVLFLRGPRGLALTSAGRTFAESAREALDRIAAAAEGVRLRRFRRLSIGAYGFFASRFLMPIWSGLRRALPDLEIDLHTSSNPVDLLASRFDAVIAVSDAQPRPGLVRIPLMPISTVPVCAPGLIKRGPLDFAAVPLLHARPRPDDWRRWLDHAGLANVPVQGGSSFESLSLAIEAAAAGLGVAITIDGLLAPDLASGAVVKAHPAVRPTRRSFVLEYEQRLAEDPAVAAFSAWICDPARRDQLPRGLQPNGARRQGANR